MGILRKYLPIQSGEPLSNEKINILLQNLPHDQILNVLWELESGKEASDLKNLLNNLHEDNMFLLLLNSLFSETHKAIDNILGEYLDEWLDLEIQEGDISKFNKTQKKIFEKWIDSVDSQFSSKKLKDFLGASLRDSALAPTVSRYYYLLNQQKFGRLDEDLLELLESTLSDGKVLRIPSYDELLQTIDEVVVDVCKKLLFTESDEVSTINGFRKSLTDKFREDHFSFPEQLLKNLLIDTSVFQLSEVLNDIKAERRKRSKNKMDDSIALMNALLRRRLTDLLNVVADQIKDKLAISSALGATNFTEVMQILEPILEQLGFLRKDFTLLKGIWGYRWYNGIVNLSSELHQIIHSENNQTSDQEILNDEDLRQILKNLKKIPLSDPFEEINNLDRIMLANETDDWRKVDIDWLKNAENLALKLDSDTNNTSLVLAIELIESGKVLLFPGDAQAGNWLSWKNVNFDVEDKNGDIQKVNAQDLLRRTVFYKVGHHGSHNATMKDEGLEIIGTESEDLVAMIPVEKNMVAKKKWNMPFPPLYKRLLEKTAHRIIRADDGIVPGPVDPESKKKWDQFEKAVKEVPDDGEGKPGYFEYVVS